MGKYTPRMISYRIVPLLTLALVLFLAACGRAGATLPVPVSPATEIPDFGIVAYQGDDLLGGHETTFANVFAHGKPVVLNFWAGLCPPCRAEMPAFQRVADEYAGKVIFVGVDVSPYIGLGSHDDARRLLDELGIDYPAVYAVDASPLQLYQVQGMPTTLFLTADGRLAHKQSGLLLETQLRTLVEALAAGSS